MYKRLNFENGRGEGRIAERLVLAGCVVAVVSLIGLWTFHSGEERHQWVMEYVRTQEYKDACRDRELYWERLGRTGKSEMRNEELKAAEGIGNEE